MAAFATGTGEPMWRISQWNGTNWDSIGHGLDGLVLSITKYKGEIYAGGWFVSSFDSVGTKFPGLAKWNGTNWVKIENDTTPQCCVLELYTYDNDLYVGGTFDSINGQLAARGLQDMMGQIGIIILLFLMSAHIYMSQQL
ncbi:MAG: hypothetical protein IPP34_20460 [Bacteroidetes bacterium]|nr:hypothetical protein [Bacteroidota bacterium]